MHSWTLDRRSHPVIPSGLSFDLPYWYRVNDPSEQVGDRGGALESLLSLIRRRSAYGVISAPLTAGSDKAIEAAQCSLRSSLDLVHSSGSHSHRHITQHLTTPSSCRSLSQFPGSAKVNGDREGRDPRSGGI